MTVRTFIKRAKNKIRRILIKTGLKEQNSNLINTEKQIYYLKIRLPLEHDFYDKRIKLFKNKILIWGTVLEKPSPNNPYPSLEYRNILVESEDTNDYTINFESLDFEIEISQKQYITPEQKSFDEKYQIKPYKNLYRAESGNLVNPKKIIITFGGYTIQTSPVNYIISNLTQITSDPKIEQNCTVIAFQDRYYFTGSYMTLDDKGNDLYANFCQLIKERMNQYNLSEEDLIFYGASKGGNIAIRYFRQFRKGTLVVSVPQLDFLYYTYKKKFFLDNFFHYYKNKVKDNSIELMEEYIDQGSNVYHFYTNDDELSNVSLIERKNNKNKFQKFRFEGIHGAVTKKSMITTKHIFASTFMDIKIMKVNSEVRKIIDDQGLVKMQIYIEALKNYILEKKEAFVTIFDQENNLLFSSEILAHPIESSIFVLDDLHEINLQNDLGRGEFTFKIEVYLDNLVKLVSDGVYTVKKNTELAYNTNIKKIFSQISGTTNYVIVEGPTYSFLTMKYYNYHNKINALYLTDDNNLQFVDDKTLVLNFSEWTYDTEIIEIFIYRMVFFHRIRSIKVDAEYGLLFADIKYPNIQVIIKKLAAENQIYGNGIEGIKYVTRKAEKLKKQQKLKVQIKEPKTLFENIVTRI